MSARRSRAPQKKPKEEGELNDFPSHRRNSALLLPSQLMAISPPHHPPKNKTREGNTRSDSSPSSRSSSRSSSGQRGKIGKNYLSLAQRLSYLSLEDSSTTKPSKSRMAVLFEILGACPHSPRCDIFPILDLPDKPITKIFSFLSIEDRMKLRLNKRLNGLVLESKYFVQNLMIGELPQPQIVEHRAMKGYLTYKSYRNDQKIMFKEAHSHPLDEGQTHSLEFLRKVAQTTTIGQLTVKFRPGFEFNRKIALLMKEFDANHLILEVDPDNTRPLKFSSAFFLKLAKACKLVETSCCWIHDSAPGLFDLFKVMSEGSTKLRSIQFWMIHAEVSSLLALIGITLNLEDGNIHSKRECDAFIARRYSPSKEVRFLHIFIGSFELRLLANRNVDRVEFKKERELSEIDWHGEREHVKFHWHESKESLETAKGEDNLTRFPVIVDQE